MRLKPRIFRKPQLTHPLARGLAAYWLLNEGTGRIVNDLSGNGNYGIFVGDLFWTGGRNGVALNFPGSNDYINVSDSSELRFDSATQDFSMFAVVQSNVGVPDDVIIDKRDANDDGWVLRTVSGAVWLSVNGIDVKGTIDIGDGNCHFVGAVADRSGNGQVYIDGVADGAPVDVSGQAMSTSVDIRIGRSTIGANEWNGLMEIVYIYNRILSASEVHQLHRDLYILFRQDPVWMGQAPVVVGANPKGPLTHPLYGPFAGPIAC